MIGKMLGHTQAATTKRYAHMAEDPLRQSIATVSKRMVRRGACLHADQARWLFPEERQNLTPSQLPENHGPT
jgi:hypothetical protein